MVRDQSIFAFESGTARWRLLQGEITVRHQPLVHANAAIHSLCAMIGDHKDIGRGVGKFEQFTDFAVDFLVVIMDRVLEFVSGLIEAVGGSMLSQSAWWMRSVPISTIIK